MMMKVFKIGKYWDHGPRIRETIMGESLSICPLSLLFKDHKGWTAGSGTVPPTRPVVGGHMGINLHLSELVSDILDPVVGHYEGGMEVISTEDLIARMEMLNTRNKGWTSTSFWGGLTTDEYRACQDCIGTDDYCWDEDDPETCACDDGVDELGRMMVTMGCMKRLRRARWEAEVLWEEGDLDRQFLDDEVLPEDKQDQSSPMIVVGTDVENLYPSLDIVKVVDTVREAVMNTKVTWEEVDYLEAARYVALNWSETQCRGSKLGRVLPYRRYVTGTRPGLKGAGPQGGLRGDQEQWCFPRVRLRVNEKRLLVATVVSIATQAMFKHHFYGFANKKFQQKEGGPIGLRGTCTIARLCMQVFDKKWGDLVGRTGLKIDLYSRYMDDGRIFLHPIQRGWRWVEGSGRRMRLGACWTSQWGPSRSPCSPMRLEQTMKITGSPPWTPA